MGGMSRRRRLILAATAAGTAIILLATIAIAVNLRGSRAPQGANIKPHATAADETPSAAASPTPELSPSTAPPAGLGGGGGPTATAGPEPVAGSTRALSQASMAFDAARSRVVLFGGTAGVGHGNANGTRLWDGQRWTEAHPDHVPPARLGASMAYDEVHRVVVLFGGGWSPVLNDTWTWDGTDWTEMHPSAMPSTRALAGMDFDQTLGRIVLFGGMDGGALMTDTWAWDGRNWTELHPASSPPKLIEPHAVYHAASKKLVVFGSAFDADQRQVGETWLYDGSTWTMVISVRSRPNTRSGTTLAKGPDGKLVLMGGRVQSTPGPWDDTWTWDGSGWGLVAPATRPPARENAALAYDSARGQTVLFSGVKDPGTWLDDTWIWNGTTWTLKPTS